MTVPAPRRYVRTTPQHAVPGPGGSAGPSAGCSAAAPRGRVRAAALAIALVIGLGAGGCASTAPRDTAAADGEPVRAVRNVDPFERFNRDVFAFNEALDNDFFKPFARFYDAYTPRVIRLIVGNVLSNFLDPYIALNNLLQGKPADAASDMGRFLLNSTFGFFGFGDPASEIGLVKHREDFGQTLGVWGVPAGPYLMLPFFGPSSLRDGIGLAVDLNVNVTDRISQVRLRNTLTGFGLVESRVRLLPAERLLADALDRYLLVRDGYLQRRRSQVYDGNPPDED